MRIAVAVFMAVTLLGGCAEGFFVRDEVFEEEIGVAVDGGAAGGGADAACAAVVEFNGQTYDGYGVQRAPDVGEKLGQGVFPPCNDTGGSDEKASKSPVAAIKGVDPGRAIVVLSQPTGMVWVKHGTKLPKSLQPLMGPPTCQSEGSFRLEGDWLGILDNGTDRVPPYRLEMFVTSTSGAEAEQYSDAQIVVRVTDKTSGLVTMRDLKKSLWRGGTMRADVHCDDGAFVADDLAFFAPKGR